MIYTLMHSILFDFLSVRVIFTTTSPKDVCPVTRRFEEISSSGDMLDGLSEANDVRTSPDYSSR